MEWSVVFDSLGFPELRVEKVAECGAGAGDARHDGADGNVEDKGDVFVLNLFDVAEKKDFAELRLKLLECIVEGGLVVEANEIVFGGGTGRGGVECVGMIFERDGAGGGDA